MIDTTQRPGTPIARPEVHTLSPCPGAASAQLPTWYIAKKTTISVLMIATALHAATRFTASPFVLHPSVPRVDTFVDRVGLV